MKKYSFSNKNDINKEAIDTKEFKSMLDAIIYFSSVKSLHPDEFMNLYNIWVNTK